MLLSLPYLYIYMKKTLISSLLFSFGFPQLLLLLSFETPLGCNLVLVFLNWTWKPVLSIQFLIYKNISTGKMTIKFLNLQTWKLENRFVKFNKLKNFEYHLPIWKMNLQIYRILMFSYTTYFSLGTTSLWWITILIHGTMARNSIISYYSLTVNDLQMNLRVFFLILVLVPYIICISFFFSNNFVLFLSFSSTFDLRNQIPLIIKNIIHSHMIRFSLVIGPLIINRVWTIYDFSLYFRDHRAFLSQKSILFQLQISETAIGICN